MKRDNTPLLIGILIFVILIFLRTGRIESELERNKPSKEVRQANYELQLWNEYRAEKEKR